MNVIRVRENETLTLGMDVSLGWEGLQTLTFYILNSDATTALKTFPFAIADGEATIAENHDLTRGEYKWQITAVFDGAITEIYPDQSQYDNFLPPFVVTEAYAP
jgi:hypothetical protein